MAAQHPAAISMETFAGILPSEGVARSAALAAVAITGEMVVPDEIAGPRRPATWAGSLQNAESSDLCWLRV